MKQVLNSVLFIRFEWNPISLPPQRKHKQRFKRKIHPSILASNIEGMKEFQRAVSRPGIEEEKGEKCRGGIGDGARGGCGE